MIYYQKSRRKKLIGSIAKLLKGLSDNSHPGEIAHAVSCGFILGFMPKDNMLWYIIFILFLFLRINKGALLLIMFAGSALTFFLDSIFHSVGYYVLTIEEIAPYMTTFLNIPAMAYTKINNTIVAGSLVCAILAYIPFYVLARLFVLLWRTTIGPFLKENKVVKGFFKLPIVDKIHAAYVKVEAFRG